MCCMFYQSHHCRLHHTNNIWLRVQVRKLSLSSCHFLSNVLHSSLFYKLQIFLLARNPTLVGLAAFPISLSYPQSMEPSDGGSAHHKASTYTQDNTNSINAYRHSCLKWDLNPLPQHSSRQRQFMPQTERPLRSVNARNSYSLNVTPNFTPMKNNSYNCNKNKHSDLTGTKQSLISILI
jgi:hypothetical protein